MAGLAVDNLRRKVLHENDSSIPLPREPTAGALGIIDLTTLSEYRKLPKIQRAELMMIAFKAKNKADRADMFARSLVSQHMEMGRYSDAARVARENGLNEELKMIAKTELRNNLKCHHESYGVKEAKGMYGLTDDEIKEVAKEVIKEFIKLIHFFDQVFKIASACGLSSEELKEIGRDVVLDLYTKGGSNNYSDANLIAEKMDLTQESRLIRMLHLTIYSK